MEGQEQINDTAMILQRQGQANGALIGQRQVNNNLALIGQEQVNDDMATDKRNSLKCIFVRSFNDPVFRQTLGQLCALYLGGIWTTVPCEKIHVAKLAGGMNNIIFTVELPDGIKAQVNEPKKAILRVYGNLSENYELPEATISTVLAERHLGPRLLGVFAGGRLEEYIPSRSLTNNEYRKPCIAQEVGRILARIHSLEMPISKECQLAHFLDDLIDGLKRSDRWKRSHPMHTTLAKVNKELCPNSITIDLLAAESEICKECLARSGSPIVFSNNDLHAGNLLLRNGIKVTDQGLIGRKNNEDPIVLIDYEYGCYYYRGYSLSHYCVECCQHYENEVWPFYEVQQNQWPDEEIQRLYVSAYIDEANKICREKRDGKKIRCIIDLPDDHDQASEHLLKEIRQFAAFPHLFWSIWSLQHAEIDHGDFDQFEYAFDRLAMYYYWKPEMLKYLNR